MTFCSLDTLLVAVQSALTDANGVIRQRRMAMLGTNESPQATIEHALHVEIPHGPAPDAPCQPLTLPLSMFRDRRVPQVSMLSIEFDCSLRFHALKGHRDPQLHLRIGKPRFTWWRRQKVHRICISFLSANAWQPQVDIDGRTLIAPTTTPLQREAEPCVV